MDWKIILDRMEKLGMSMNKLSIEIGKDRSQVHAWINRGTIPQADSLIKIAKVLGMRVEYFFPEEYPIMAEHSDRRRRFYSWVDEMTEEEMESIEALFKVLGAYGEKLGE